MVRKIHKPAIVLFHPCRMQSYTYALFYSEQIFSVGVKLAPETRQHLFYSTPVSQCLESMLLVPVT